MGYEDLERYSAASESPPLSPRSPTRSRFSRTIHDQRRKIAVFGLLAFFVILSVVGVGRKDDIKHIIKDHGSAWTASASHKLQHLKNATHSVGNAVQQLHHDDPEKVTQGPVLGDRSLSKQSLQDIRNSTLGVQQVYVLNMPGRTDKSDAMRLMASVSGFNFQLLDATKGSDMPKKAMPNGGDFGEGERDPGVVGCWRGHMDFAARILENGLSSAMIMEDDIDWDVDMRSQLENVALGAQTLLQTPTGSTPHSPFGDGWDIVWLGHCASQTTPGDHRRFIMKNDRTVTPPNHRADWGAVPQMSGYDSTTRIMYFAAGGTCTYAYALSHSGAQKILKTLSLDLVAQPIDIALHEMCLHKSLGFKCIGVFPQIFAEHKPAGPVNKDSDINTSDTGEVRKHGFSWNIVRSTRLNVDKLVLGQRDNVTSQFADGHTAEIHGPVQFEYKNDDSASEENVWLNQRRRRYLRW